VIAAIRALRRYARPYRRALLLGVLLTVVDVGANLAKPWPLGFVVDEVFGADRSSGQAQRLLVWAAASLLLIVGVGALADYWSSRLLSSSGLQLANDVRDDVFRHLHRLSLDFHRSHQVGDLSSRATADVDRAQDMLVQSLAVLVPNGLLLVGMFVVMCVVSLELTLVALIATPVLVVAVHRTSRALKKASRRARKADGQVAAATTESLGAIQTVQAFSLEAEQQRRFSRLTEASLAAGLEAVRHQARFSPVVDTASALSTVSVLTLGGRQVIAGEMRLGVLLVFLSYLGSLYKPVKQLSKLGTANAKGAAATERVVEVLNAQPSISDAPDAVDLEPVNGLSPGPEPVIRVFDPSVVLGGRVCTTARDAEIELVRGVSSGRSEGCSVGLHGVTFSYGRESVLQEIDLTVAAGEHLALVGPTGSGKSTIAALIARLVDPQNGWVSVDGLDIRKVTLASLRGQISMVLQDTVLLRGTIRDNIAWGRPGATDEQVRSAARLALVDEFACRLPQGLDTPIGERGLDLSGGQRQRIAIARAILRDTRLLILDEPTSALDPTSEAILVEALDNLPRARTRVVIAHRLSTVQRADRIAVLHEGRIVETGSHRQLLATGGRYAGMHAAGSIAAESWELEAVGR
jgi:ABC-type multidrug transport system fused ATPase/permease subunit